MARIEQERERWDELTKLADAGDVRGFYAKYVEYLDWCGVISRGRQTIRKMAVAAQQLLSE